MPVVAVVTGFAWLVSGRLVLAAPPYDGPISRVDHAAAAPTSVAWALLAPSLLWVASRGGRCSRIAAAFGAVAALVAAGGNLLGEVNDVSVFGFVHLLGGLGLVLALIATAVLLMRQTGGRLGAAVGPAWARGRPYGPTRAGRTQGRSCRSAALAVRAGWSSDLREQEDPSGCSTWLLGRAWRALPLPGAAGRVRSRR